MSEELFSWLLRKRSKVLQFEEVRPVVAGSTEGVDLDTGDQGEGSATGAGETDQGDLGGDTHTGEGEELGGGEGEENTGASVPAPASSLDAPAFTTSGPVLASIDAKVSAALAAAGWDTVEKLATATVEDLVKVQGIGKVRAEAILSEVRG